MALIDVCRLSSNGKGGYEGSVRADVQGEARVEVEKDRWVSMRYFVPSGTKFTIWQLGDKDLDAYLLTGMQPGEDNLRFHEHLMCRLWSRAKTQKKGHTGTLTTYKSQEYNWKWELPNGLRFYAFRDGSGFQLTIQEPEER